MRNLSKKNKMILISAAAALAVVVIIIILASAFGGDSAGAPPAATDTPTPELTATPAPTATPEPEMTIGASIAIGGDAVMHTGLNTEAQSDTGYDYSPIFGIIKDRFDDVDYAVCTMVTTFSPGTAYSAYPRFKSPDSLAESLSSVGFDLVNTATSHAADSFKDGVDYTIETLTAAGLDYVGTYASEEERAENAGAVIADLNGIKVAFMSYTCDTNQIPVSGYEYAVNVCTTDYLSGATEIDYEMIAADMEAVRALDIDLIFVFMSWGREFDTEPSTKQEEIADFLFENGADIIIGGHTRVPQRMEMREVTDIDGNAKAGFVCYSLGNLISCQNDRYTDISAIINVEIEKGIDSGRTTITSISYEPIFMVDLYDYGIDDYGWHFRLANLHAAIDAYDSGEPWAFMTEEIYNDMQEALGTLHSLFGADMDYYN